MPLGEQLAPHFARLVLDPPVRRARPARWTRAVQRVSRSPRCAGSWRELSGRNVEGRRHRRARQRQRRAAGLGRREWRQLGAAQVDGVLAHASGSTLKPFVYELAFERRLLRRPACSTIRRRRSHRRNGLYLPQNYDHDFKGWVSVRTALGANSLNVPAVRTGMLGRPMRCSRA